MKPEGAAQRERNNMGKISYWADLAESSQDCQRGSRRRLELRFLSFGFTEVVRGLPPPEGSGGTQPTHGRASYWLASRLKTRFWPFRPIWASRAGARCRRICGHAQGALRIRRATKT